MGKLYRSHKIQYYNNRPVHKVEVVEESNHGVTFETDYPVESITIPRDEFFSKFEKW